MKSIFLKTVVILTTIAFLMGACNPVSKPQPPSFPRTMESKSASTPTSEANVIILTDALGRNVTLPQPPMRIAIAGRATALLADASFLFPEATERIVAVSSTNQGSGDFLDAVDPNFSQKIAYDTNAGPEQVAAANPDLVIMKSYMAETLGAPLQQLGIPVVYLDLETPEQYQRDLLTLGKIFQNEPRAQELAQYYQTQVDQVSETLADLSAEDRPRVLLLYHSNRDGQIAFNVPPAQWIQTILVELAGGTPVWKDIELGSGWTKVSLEQIAAWNADQIYIISYTGNPDEIINQLASNSEWQALKAVQSKALYAFPKDYYSWDQPDPRWILGLRWLACRIHPVELGKTDMVLVAREFLSQWYGLDEVTFDQFILPKLQGSFK